jgi:hypothetical protein
MYGADPQDNASLLPVVLEPPEEPGCPPYLELITQCFESVDAAAAAQSAAEKEKAAAAAAKKANRGGGGGGGGGMSLFRRNQQDGKVAPTAGTDKNEDLSTAKTSKSSSSSKGFLQSLSSSVSITNVTAAATSVAHNSMSMFTGGSPKETHAAKQKEMEEHQLRQEEQLLNPPLSDGQLEELQNALESAAERLEENVPTTAPAATAGSPSGITGVQAESGDASTLHRDSQSDAYLQLYIDDTQRYW